MARSPGIAVPAAEAEATRRRLGDRVRRDLRTRSDGSHVIFPLGDPVDATGEYDFEARPERPSSYMDLLGWDDVSLAPRAFDVMGDLVIVKVPDDVWDQRHAVGEALLEFHGARAVFHDNGVKGEFRVRDVERIAGDGDTRTTIRENGLTLHVDPGRAYYSPRLADERSRVAGLVQPGERFVDLFGGCAPMALLAARAGADATSIDLNPEATRLAQENARENGLRLEAICGDARDVAPGLPAADRILMNLPHGARDFLDVAAVLAAPGATIHFHEIVDDDQVDQVDAELARLGTVTRRRHVRAYSAGSSHYVWDVRR